MFNQQDFAWVRRLFYYGLGVAAFASLFKNPSHGVLIAIILLAYWKFKKH